MTSVYKVCFLHGKTHIVEEFVFVLNLNQISENRCIKIIIIKLIVQTLKSFKTFSLMGNNALKSGKIIFYSTI